MLVYHPAYDINHCAFRLIVLSIHFDENIIVEWDKLRILDFYYIFPYLLNSVSLPNSTKISPKKIKALLKKPYESLPSNPRRLLFELKSLQYQAALFLVSKDIFLKNEFLSGNIRLNKSVVPNLIFQELDSLDGDEKILIRYLSSVLVDIPLEGDGGLKERTQLMEYRYAKSINE